MAKLKCFVSVVSGFVSNEIQTKWKRCERYQSEERRRRNRREWSRAQYNVNNNHKPTPNSVSFCLLFSPLASSHLTSHCGLIKIKEEKKKNNKSIKKKVINFVTHSNFTKWERILFTCFHFTIFICTIFLQCSVGCNWENIMNRCQGLTLGLILKD